MLQKDTTMAATPAPPPPDNGGGPPPSSTDTVAASAPAPPRSGLAVPLLVLLFVCAPLGAAGGWLAWCAALAHRLRAERIAEVTAVQDDRGGRGGRRTARHTVRFSDPASGVTYTDVVVESPALRVVGAYVPLRYDPVNPARDGGAAFRDDLPDVALRVPVERVAAAAVLFGVAAVAGGGMVAMTLLRTRAG